MPNIKSAIKRMKSSAQRSAENKRKKSEMRTAIKKAEQAMEQKSDDASDLVKHAITLVDKAAGKGRLHKNAAARIKSRLSRNLNSALAEATE